jgi:hypothetical protein
LYIFIVSFIVLLLFYNYTYTLQSLHTLVLSFLLLLYIYACVLLVVLFVGILEIVLVRSFLLAEARPPIVCAYNCSVQIYARATNIEIVGQL